MRIALVHNRYRSTMPSGENRVADTEAGALTSAGHQVIRFEKSNDEIDHWPRAKKASLPARVLWSRETYRDLSAALHEHRPDVVHVHNTFPAAEPSCPLCMPRRGGTSRGHPAQLPAGLRQRDLLPRWHHLPRLRCTVPWPPPSCTAATGIHAWPPCQRRWPSPRTGRRGSRWCPPTCSSQRHSATCSRDVGFAPGRVFVRHNLIPCRSVPEAPRGDGGLRREGWPRTRACAC